MSERIKITEMPQMPYFHCFALLAVHKLGGSSKTKDTIEEIMNFFDFEENLLEETLENGKSRLKERIRFAMVDLKMADYFAKDSKRGLYQLSDKGKLSIQQLVPLDPTEFREIGESIRKDVQQQVARVQKEKKNKEALDINDEDFSEESEEEMEYLNDLEIIQEINPYSFERLCALLFKKVGYEDVQTTQKSGDGGYDGVGYLVFGLVRFKVAFQAKKYKNDNKIGPGEIREFSGTMKQQAAEKGVFITTSDFTQKAKESGLELGIELINGEKLIGLLQKHQIGYSQRIDKKFFEEL